MTRNNQPKENLDKNKTKKYDVVGIGNSLLDLTVEVKDSFLKNLGFKKGSMNLVDEVAADKILTMIEKYPVEISAGGSCANAISALGILGAKAGFIGVIGDDDYGSQYAQLTVGTGVVGHFCRRNLLGTGFAITLVTEDGERTFATHLGASSDLKEEDLFGFKDMFDTKYLLLEGYMVENPSIRSVLEKCIPYTKSKNGKIALDVSDVGVISRMGDTLRKFVYDYVDVLFLNEKEAQEFSFLDPYSSEAISLLGRYSSIVVIKVGKNGSIIKKNDLVIKYPSLKADVINTNGAGDSFAGGFLFGLSKDLPIEECAKYATYCASKVIQQVPARLHSFDKQEFNNIWESL